MIHVPEVRSMVEMVCESLSWSCTTKLTYAPKRLVCLIEHSQTRSVVVRITRMKKPEPDDYYWQIETDSGYEARCIDDMGQIVTCTIGAVTSTVIAHLIRQEGYLDAA